MAKNGKKKKLVPVTLEMTPEMDEVLQALVVKYGRKAEDILVRAFIFYADLNQRRGVGDKLAIVKMGGKVFQLNGWEL
jgi:hypothetical protein